MVQPLFVIALLSNILFALGYLLLSDATFILVLQATLFSIACGVCTAYSKNVWELIRKRHPMDSADWLGVGIFTNWISIAGIRIWAIVWRVFGKPPEWSDSLFLTYMIFLSCNAGLFHLVATQAVGNRSPQKQWIILGAYVAFAVFVVTILNLYANGQLHMDYSLQYYE